MSPPRQIADLISAGSYQPTVLSDHIVEVLSRNILAGRLEGGQRLVESELQQTFKTSRSPIREALRELELLGLVEIRPHRGAVVKQLTREDVGHTIPVRAALEGLAARELFERITPKLLERMFEILDDMNQAAERGRREDYWDNHLRLHEFMVNAADNPVLSQALRPLRTKTQWYRFSLERREEEDLALHVKEHRKLIEHLETKDLSASAFEALVRNHVTRNLQKFMNYLENVES